MIVVGIDVGASGGIAVLDGPVVAVHKMPESEVAVCSLLRRVTDGAARIAVERVGGYISPGGPKCPACKQTKNRSPGSSMFNFGRGVGVVVGCLFTLGREHEEVEPQRWQSALGLRRPRGCSREQWKRELKARAQELHPRMQVTLWSADALLIAQYASLQCVGVAAPVAPDGWSDPFEE